MSSRQNKEFVGTTRTLAGVAALWLVLGGLRCAKAFTEVPIPLSGVRYSSVSWGDFDNDGDLDVLLAGDTGSGAITRIYRNDSGGVFADLGAGLPGITEGAAVWGDYNGDGFLDLALTGMSASGRISHIYRNNGNGTFANISAGLPGLEASTVAWGDYDNDGDLDFFLTGYTGSSYVGAIYRNDGNDTFTDSGVTTIRGGASGSAAWSDFDGDGDLDLLFAGFTLDTASGQSSRLYRNNNGAFTNITSITLTAMSEASVAWGDFDNDGDLDILIAGSSIAGVQSFPTLRLYRNNSGASFTQTSTEMGGAQNCSLAWGDYDSDGDLDIAIAGYNTSFQPFAKIYRNDGGGFFTDIAEPLTGVMDASLAWGDYDRDGDLDLILTGHTGITNITKLYRNDASFGNSPPSHALSLGSSVSGKTATMSWLGNGDANQTGGLTFNLRVGTSPGAGNVMSAMADAATGLRRVPRIGNVSQRTSWAIKLPVGRYYWDVQAVDHGFAGSAFSGEQTFDIPRQAPDVTTLPALNVTASGVTLRGTANPNGDPTAFYFDYGTTTNYGSTTTPQDLGSGVGDVSASDVLSNLLSATTYHFRAVAVNSYGASYGTNRSFVTPIFVDVTNASFLGVGGGSIAWGDQDNDGYLDLLVAGANSTGVVTRIYRNLTGTNFADIGANLAGIINGTVAWGDYDNDGDLDVLLTGNSTSRIYRNDGNNVFTDINAGLPGLGTGASAPWADMDNDGDLDFVLTGGGSTAVLLYRNDGNDQFVSATNSLPAVNDSALAWADYDNDGDMDLLLTGYNFGVGGVGEMTRLYRNDGRGSFTNSNLSLQSVSKGAVSWGDYDNDGDLDLLLAGARFSTRYSMLYSNQGGGAFASVSLSAVPKVDQGNVSWGDYDNDGDLDILIVGQASTGSVARVYRNDANLFRDSGAVLPVLGNVRAEWGDYDNDDRLDILMTGYTGSNYITRLFRNVSPNPNTPPGAPTALAATVTNNAVILNWGAATDANQPGGLTYNLRIGTAPGLSDVSSAMADDSTGFRRVPKLGNANLRQSWTITNLAAGTYDWSVQAVDHVYAGSAFSTSSSFTITAALLPPVAITRPATNVGPAGATLVGTANARGAPTTAFFQYGMTTNFGNLTAPQSIGSVTTNVSLATSLVTLAEGTTYYFRTVASNINGTAFGATRSFTTGFQFSNVVVALPAFGSGGTAWGDFDNDGDLDVALGGSGISATRICRNDGGGVFAVAVTNLPSASYGGVEWGDFDNDGDLDLLIFGEPRMAVGRNNGDGSFTVAATFTEGLFGYSFATWVDYDNDADLDIACYDAVGSNPGYANSRIYRNDGGVFVASGVPMPKMTSGWMAWADYDQDGDPDLAISGQFIVTNYIVPSTKIYRNDGHGVLVDLEAPLAGLEYTRLAWGDYDNDNDLDLLCVGVFQAGRRTILYRNDHGGFVEVSTGLPGGSGEMGWIDYDNDGDLDMHLSFYGYYYSTNRIYRNDNGIFVDSGQFFLGPTVVTWADYDNDGDRDVLVNSQLYRNNSLSPNLPPLAPAGLSAVPTGNVVTLRWAAPTDANQSGGLTYNLQVGTAPGIYDVLSAAADPSGWHRLARPGIAAHPVWKLVLPVGTYYWRVQAIDHALAGSPFSAESRFTVPVQAPAAVTDFGTTNADGYPVLNGFVNPNGMATTACFEYGLTNFEFRTAARILSNGTAWISLSATPTNLVPEANYSYRMVGSNSLGVSFGATRTFRLAFFTDRSDPLVAVIGSAPPLAWADFDGDGDLDLLVGRTDSDRLYRNDDGVFTNVLATFAATVEGGAAVADYDNDGNLDVLVSGRDGNFARLTRLYHNIGSNQFQQVALPFASLYRCGVAWTDFDNDGDLDFIIAGADSWDAPHTYVCRNDGSNTFTLAATALPNIYNCSIACADYDNDGDVDILMTGATSTGRLSRVYRNDGDFVFSGSGAVLPDLESGLAHWGDYDSDGDLDILLNGWDRNTNYLTRVFRNDAGTFVEAVNHLPGVTGASTWLDYDNDGLLDIIIGGYTLVGGGVQSVTRLYHNDGSGLFTDSGIPLQLPANSTGLVMSGDYDHDGDVDVLFGPQLLRNECNVLNFLPSTPTGLTASVGSNSVTLSWNGSNDPNQTGGLSYNVRVGNEPGGENILSGMALSDGRRLLPELGNAFARTNLTLRDLKVGAYFWSLQAIDHTRAGSAFSTNGSFIIPIQAPSLKALGVTNLAVDSVTLRGWVNPNGAATWAWFEYGRTTNYGTPTIAQSLGSGTNLALVSAALVSLQQVTTYHYRAVASNSFGITHASDATFTTPQFSEVELGITSGARVMAVGDFDNDSDLDFMLAVPGTDKTWLYLNDGYGGFSNSGVQLSGSEAMQAGDYDNDGDLDLLKAVNVTASVPFRIHRNNGNQTFTAFDITMPSGSSYSLGWGDADNDGDLDVLVSGGAFWRLYRNAGANQFTLITNATGFSASTAWADYDNDGDLDFVAAGSSTGPFAHIMRNDGTNGFNDSGIALPQVDGRPIWADYDNDGDQDLLLVDINGPGGLRLCRNDGGTAFVEISNAFPRVVWGLPAWADYDNDGDLDLFVSAWLNADRLGTIFRNNGNGTFTDIELGLAPPDGSGAVWGDFDRDGDLDFLLSAGAGTNWHVRLYRNNSTISNPPPSAPAGLSAEISNNAVTLSWTPAGDANQSGGLSYNLRVGTSPGAADVLNPSVNLATGWRKLACPGNVQQNLHWPITNLRVGMYYWSVQAVDNAFAGSAFAPEQSFFYNARPVANPQLIIMGEDTLQAITLTATDADGQAITYEVIAASTNGVLTGTPPNISYRPNLNFFGADRILFQALDGFTSSAPAMISLLVTQVCDVAQSTLAIQRQRDGQPRLSLWGEPFERYRLEASDDLVRWVALTNVVSSNGIMAVIDADAGLYPRRFYRATLALPSAHAGSPQRALGGAFQFNLSGELARRYDILASTNLAHWVLLTNVLLTTSPISFTDPGAASYSRRFYLLRPVP